MKIIEVTYEQPHNLGQYFGNDKIGFKSSVSEGENVLEVIDDLNALAVAWFNQKYGAVSHIYDRINQSPETRIHNLVEPKPIQVDKVEEDAEIYRALKTTLELAPNKKMAEAILEKSGEYKDHYTLKKIVNSKS